MKIKIGDNNRISNSNLGKENTVRDGKGNNTWVKIIIEIVVGIAIAIISGFFIYILGWN